MTTIIASTFALWTWPIQAARLGSDLMEATRSAQRVMAARLPMISDAMSNPAAADYGELGLMVTEKTTAFRSSGRAATMASDAVRRASGSNARALGKISGGGVLWPQDWLRLVEDNMAAAAALGALPAAMLAPVHRTVTANDKRLSR